MECGQPNVGTTTTSDQPYYSGYDNVDASRKTSPNMFGSLHLSTDKNARDVVGLASPQGVLFQIRFAQRRDLIANIMADRKPKIFQFADIDLKPGLFFGKEPC